jgi:hypothetical protein
MKVSFFADLASVLLEFPNRMMHDTCSQFASDVFFLTHFHDFVSISLGGLKRIIVIFIRFFLRSEFNILESNQTLRGFV